MSSITTSTQNTRLFVFGGCVLNSNPTPTPASLSTSTTALIQTAQPVLLTEYYTPHTNQWTIVKPMINLHKEAQCFTLNNYIYILGGYNIQAKTGQKLITRYDYINDAWNTVGQLTNGMTGMGACIIELPWHVFDDQDTHSLIDNCEGDDESSSSDCTSSQEEDYLEWSTQTSLQSDEDNDNAQMKKQFENKKKNKKSFKFIKKSITTNNLPLQRHSNIQDSKNDNNNNVNEEFLS